MRRDRTGTLAVVGLALGLVAAACGGGGGSGDSAAVRTATQEGKQALAQAVRIDAGVDVRLTGTDFTAVGDPVPVNVGDVVRTDDSGFAEIAYHDGSRSRLDVNTEFEVLALSDQPGEAVARTRMGLGRTWNRVHKAVQGDDAFSVETSVATATVRGTAFLVDCPAANRCSFTVVEGVIEIRTPNGAVTTLTAPATLTVEDGIASPPSPVVVDDVLAEPWVGRNADLDAGAGFPGRGTLSAPAGAPGAFAPGPAVQLPFSGGTSSDNPGTGPASLILESSENSRGTVIHLTVSNCPDTNAVSPGKPLDGVIVPHQGDYQPSPDAFTPFPKDLSRTIPFAVLDGGVFVTDVQFEPALFGTTGTLQEGTYAFELICDYPARDGTTQSVLAYYEYAPGGVHLGS